MLVLGESHIHQMAQINVNLTLTSPSSTVVWNTYVQAGNAAINVDGKYMVNSKQKLQTTDLTPASPSHLHRLSVTGPT